MHICAVNMLLRTLCLCMTAVDRALQTFMRGHLGVKHAHAFNKESVFGCFKNMI